MGPWVKVKGTGRVDWGSYKPGNQTRSGRNTQRPQWLVQSRVEEGDRIKKMKPEERLKLLKKTLKKSNALTEKLLERLDREWDDIYQEDSENDEVASEASANSSRRNSSVYDSDGSVRSLESIEKVLQRRNKMRTRVVYDDETETSDSEFEDERSNKRKKNLRNGGEKRARVDYRDSSSNEGSESDYLPSANYLNQFKPKKEKKKRKRFPYDESDDDTPKKPEPPRFTSSGRVSKKPQMLLYDVEKKKKKSRKHSSDEESDEDKPLARKKKGGKNSIQSDEESFDEDAPLAWTKKKSAKNGKKTKSDEDSNNEEGDDEHFYSSRELYNSLPKSKRGRPSRNKKVSKFDDDEESSEDDFKLERAKKLFSGKILKISCKNLSAKLHTDRFVSGGKGECIQLGEEWLTPNKFEIRAGSRSKKYKVSIKCDKGISIGEYIAKGYLMENTTRSKNHATDEDEGSSEDVPVSRKPGPLSKTRKSENGSKRRSGRNGIESDENEGSSEDVSVSRKPGPLSRRKGKKEEEDDDFNPAGNGKIKTLLSDEDEEEEEDESVDEELKKQLADEVENQNKSGHLDISTADGDATPILSREGRKWNGKSIPPEQPLLISGGIMKPYQIEGMMWMANLRKAGANGILADEMGLGKTLQTISLFCLLSEVDKNAGPFLVIAPLSTLLNWKREVERFAPGVPAKLLYPKQKAVEEWDYLEDRHPSPLGKNKTLGTIYITSYETAVSIRSMLKEVNWTYIAVDEGHRLKNKDCRLSVELRKIKSKNRLLLTGTPLQNDMEELIALLSYLQPKLFKHNELFSDYYDAKKLHNMGKKGANAIIHQEQKNNILSQIHRIVGPFILRRKKADVDTSILPKKEVVVYCPMTLLQRQHYQTCVRVLRRDTNLAEVQQNNAMRGFMMHDLMKLRHCCNHPYLRQPPAPDADPQDVIDKSGKMQVLHQMLKRLGDEGHKTLVFSQFTTVLDLIGKSLKLKGYSYVQLDGRVKLEERQDGIDKFFKDEDTKIFLLSTRAGGLGLNLIAADTCIIYDSDWNPQQDLQAQDRCHRIGQTRPVVIFRLVTKNTIDESIVQRAQAKRAIEKLVVHEDKFKSGQASLKETANKVLTAKEIMEILLNQDDLDATEEASDDQYGLADKLLDELMDRTDIVKEWLAKGGILPKNSDFKFNCAEAVNNVTADIKEEDEGEDKNVAESIFDCLICRRPFMGAANKIIKTCNRFTCRYAADKLLKGPKVQLDRKFVEDYLNYDSEEEREKAEREKLRKLAKKKFYKKLKGKSPVKKDGNEVTVVDVDDGEDDDDGNVKSDGNDANYSEPEEIPESDSDVEEISGDDDFKPNAALKKKLNPPSPTKSGFIKKFNPMTKQFSEVRKGTFQCDLCTKAPYTTIGALTQHKKIQHKVFPDGKKHQCDLCNKAPYSTKKSLKRHKLSVHGAAMTSKSDEKKKKSIYNSLIISLSSDEEENKNDQKPKTPNILKKNSPMKKSSSPGGRKSFQELASQVRSPVKTNVDGPLRCQFCEYGADKGANLKNHVLNHFKDKLFPLLPRSKPFSCPECNVPHRDLITLLRHFSWSHNMFFRFGSKEDLNPRPKDQPVRDPKSAKPSPITSPTKNEKSSEKPAKVENLSSSISRPKPGPKSKKPSIVMEEKPEVVSLSSSNENSNGSSGIEGSDPKLSEDDDDEKPAKVVSLSSSISRPKPGPKSKKPLIAMEEKASEHSDLDDEEKPEVVSLASANENSNDSSSTIGSYQKFPEEDDEDEKSDIAGDENSA